METMYWLYGACAGFIGPFIAVPVVIIGATFVLKNGNTSGIALGFGNALVQLVYAALAGLSTYSGGALQQYDKYFEIFGAIILFYIAFYFWKNAGNFSAEQAKQYQSPRSLGTSFIAGILLSIAAPQRILLYVGIFSAFGVSYTQFSNHLLINQYPLAIGAFLGTLLWWTVFVCIISTYRNKINPERFQVFSKIGAVLIAIMALFSLTPLLQ